MASTQEKDALAGLLSRATTSEIRNCISNYDNSLSPKQQYAKFMMSTRDILIDTLCFLGATDKVKNMLKADLAQKMILEIKAMLPDICDICENGYCTSLYQKSLLVCIRCGQGSHDDCISKLISDASEIDSSATKSIFNPIFNPMYIPGLKYMCSRCWEQVIPKCNAFQLTPHNNKDTADTAMHDGDRNNGKTDRACDTKLNSTKPTNIQHDKPGNQAMNQINPNSEYDTENHNDYKKEKDPKIPTCTHYSKGRCKHGPSGKQNGICHYIHPRPCPVLMRHGPKTKDNPKGCPGQQVCDKWHPMICKTSLKVKECKYERCRFRHLIGTKKKYNSYNNELRKELKKPTENSSSATDTGHFLDVMRVMKRELMEAMEKRIEELREAHIPPPQPQMYQIPPGYPYYLHREANIPYSVNEENHLRMGVPQGHRWTEQ